MVTTGFTTDRIDRMYKLMKADISRHEALAFEMASKFDVHHKVLKEASESIEALKTYALVTDLHLEAYQPLQIATIVYEIGRGGVEKSRQAKYMQHFANKIIKNLEKNCLNVCDPNIDQFHSRYQKMNYRLPCEVRAYL
jgi:hypothetical protein